MSSRKEEERNEKIVRGLMKLPPNRRCINCNSLGPQYVCTNFWTFVCVTCSGIHREFTHRVKSVSMSKFTSQEVEALQEGGNQRARETYLKDWDPRGQRLPDNSNVDKVREFIKSVYVDKKFFASKASGKPPRDIQNLRNHEDETRRASSYHSYSQSPPYDYQYEERRYGKQAPALTKKPGSDRGMLRFLSTSRLSDHGQEDGFANEVSNGRVSNYSLSSGQRGFGFSSPEGETGRDISSEDIQQHSLNTFLNLKAKGDPNQSLDSVSKQTTEMQNNKDSTLPSLPNSSEAQKFDGLDLFSAPYAPQTTTPTSSSTINPFQLSDTSSAMSVNSSQPPHLPPTSSVNQPSQAFGPSSLDLFSIMPLQQSAETLKDKSPDLGIQKNEGWATFDMPWHVGPSQDTKSSIPISETSTSNESLGKFEQALSMETSSHWSSQQNVNANGASALTQNPWHGGVHDIGAPPGAMNNLSWSAFEESVTPFESIYAQSNKQIPVQDPLVADPYFGWGISENFKIQQADVDTRPLQLSTAQSAVGSIDSLCELPIQDGPQSCEVDTKSRNPFDLPSDSDLESSNVFLDMSSLQSALPNHNMPTAWFPESAAMPYAPADALVFMAGQASSRQIPNIQAQGPVASSIGGNPFG